MGSIFDINPSDFGLKPTSPTLSPSNITKSVDDGIMTKPIPSPGDDPDLFKKVLQTGEVSMPDTIGRPITQYFDKEQLKRYNGNAEYSPTMNPFSDNEKVMADNFSKWDALSVGVSGMIDNGIAAFSEYSKFWPRLGRAALNFDWDYTKGDQTDLEIEAERSKLVGINNPIYYPEGVGQHDIFTRQFLSSALQNAGFTLGTMAGFATEAIVFKKLGNFSKLFQLGAAAKSAEVSRELGQGSRFLNLFTKEKALQETAENMVRNGSSELGKETAYNGFLKFATHLPIVGAVAESQLLINEARAAREVMGAAALTEAEIARIGRGGVIRGLQEYNFAASEASQESGNTYGDIYEDLIEKYKADNDNNEPDEDTKQGFRLRALEGATIDYGSNVATLAIMNKLAFGNVFRKFGVDSKYLNLLQQEGSKVYAVARGGADPFFKTYKRKFFGAIHDAADIKKFFGTGTLVKEVGKDIVRGVGKIELLEGLQENIQDGINFSLRKHYKDLYDGRITTWGEDFKAAVEDQKSKKGWATFLQGAMTGLFISPITGSMTAIQDVMSETKEHKEQLKKVLDALNKAGADVKTILKEPVKNIKLQAQFNNSMTQAAKNNLVYEYFNNRSSALIQHALYAKRTGTYDAFKTFIKGYADFNATDFEEATGVNLADFGTNSPAEFVSSLVGKLDRYGELYEKYNKGFGQYYSVDSFDDDPRAKERYSFSVAALQDAIHNIAFNEAKAEDGAIRSADIARTISSKSKTIGQAASSTFNTITDYSQGQLQVSILENEIKTLEEIEGTKSQETLDMIASKKEELETLKLWNEKAYVTNKEAMEDQEIEITNPLDFTTLSEDKQSELADILLKYYSIKNKQNNIKTTGSLTEIKSALQDINDYQRLSRDSKDYMRAVNLLSDPKNALRAMHNFEDARVGAFARLMHDKYTELAKLSGVFEEYINNNPKDMEELLKLARSPFTSIDNLNKLYDHLDNINKMVETSNENAAQENERINRENAEKFHNNQKQLYNLIESAPHNLELMTDAEVADFIGNHYDINYADNEDETFLGLQRYYTDADDKKQVTHDIDKNQIAEFFKDKEGFNPDDIGVDDLKAFARAFEQGLFNEENGTAPVPESTQEQQVIANEVKKLKNLINRQVIYQGKKGVLKVGPKGYYIEVISDVTERIVLKPEFVGKLIYATPGAGKSTLSNLGENIIDADALMIEEINTQYPQLQRGVVYSPEGTSDLEGKSTDTKDARSKRYSGRPANRMQKYQENDKNRDLTKDEIEEIEAYIESAKQSGWDADRLFRQLNSLGYTYAFGNSPEAFKNYLEDRLSGKTNINVTSEFNFEKETNAELAALESKSTETKADLEKEKQKELNSNIELLNVEDVRRPNGAIGTQGFDPSQMKDLVKFIADEIGVSIPSDLLDKNIDKLKPLIDYIKDNEDLKNKIIEYVKRNPSEISVMPDGSIQFLDGNHRANLLNIIGSDVIPVINQSKKKEIESKYAESAASKTNQKTAAEPVDENETDQNFIFRFTKIFGTGAKNKINESVLTRINELKLQGKTILTGSIAFIKDSDVVLTVPSSNSRVIQRFGNEEAADKFLEKEKKAAETSGKTLTKLDTNLENHISTKPVSTGVEVIEGLGYDYPAGTSRYEWITNPETGQVEMTDLSSDLTLNDILGLELLPEGLNEKEKTITGVNPNSQTINDHVFEILSENKCKIDGREYTINIDENDNLLGITYQDEDGNVIFLSEESADRSPNGVAAKLLNAVKMVRLQDGVNVTEETLDEANKTLNSISNNQPIRITKKSKGQITKDLINVMVDTMPDDVADIFDKYINTKTRNQLKEDEIKRLSSWASDTYSKLKKLDETEDVVNAIDYISKNIINPINKKYGEQVSTNPGKRGQKSNKGKAKTANVSAKPATEGPAQSTEGISEKTKSGIINSSENAKNQIDKHRKEMAVKMEQLLPSSNSFTAPDIDEAIKTAELAANALAQSKKETINKDPYSDPSSFEDFNCI